MEPGPGRHEMGPTGPSRCDQPGRKRAAGGGENWEERPLTARRGTFEGPWLLRKREALNWACALSKGRPGGQSQGQQAGPRASCPESEWLSQGPVWHGARGSCRSESSLSSPDCKWGQERAPPPDLVNGVTERQDLWSLPVSAEQVVGRGLCQDR